MNQHNNSSNGVANGAAFSFDEDPDGSNTNNSHPLPPRPTHPHAPNTPQRGSEGAAFSFGGDPHAGSNNNSHPLPSTPHHPANTPQRGSGGLFDPPGNVTFPRSSYRASSPIRSTGAGYPGSQGSGSTYHLPSAGSSVVSGVTYYPGSQGSIASPHHAALYQQYQHQHHQQQFAPQAQVTAASTNHPLGVSNFDQSHGHSISSYLHPEDQEEEYCLKEICDSQDKKIVLAQQKAALAQQEAVRAQQESDAFKICWRKISNLTGKYNRMYSDGKMKDVIEMSKDMSSDLCSNYLEAALRNYAENQFAVTIADALRFLEEKKKDGIIIKLRNVLTLKKAELQHMIQDLDADENAKVEKHIQRVECTMSNLDITQRKCEETIELLDEIASGRRIELSYVERLIKGALFSDEIITRITTNVLFHYFYRGNQDDMFETLRFEMLDFGPKTENNSMEERARGYLVNVITMPVADGLFKFLYSILHNGQLQSDKALSFQDGMKANLKRASEARIIAHKDFFLSNGKGGGNKPKALHSIQGSWEKVTEVEQKRFCLANILGYIEPGQQDLSFSFENGFQSGKQKESEELNAMMVDDL